MAKKKEGFFSRVTDVVTQTTPEQRARKKAEEMKIRQLQQQAYKEERMKQAVRVGHVQAKVRADRAIQKIKAKPQGGAGGLFGGQPQKGFDPFTFGSSSTNMGKKPSNVPSVNSIANMTFTDYSQPQKAKAQVKKKLRKKRVKRRVKKK